MCKLQSPFNMYLFNSAFRYCSRAGIFPLPCRQQGSCPKAGSQASTRDEVWFWGCASLEKVIKARLGTGSDLRRVQAGSGCSRPWEAVFPFPLHQPLPVLGSLLLLLVLLFPICPGCSPLPHGPVYFVGQLPSSCQCSCSEECSY